MSTKMENIDLNFTLNAKAVEQSGKALQKSLEQGLGAVSFDVLRKNADRAFKSMGDNLRKALNQKVDFDTSNIEKKFAKLHSKRQTMERQLALESVKLQDSSGKKQGFFARQKMALFKRYKAEEMKLIQLKQKGMEKLNKLATKHVAIMKKAGGGGGGGVMGMFGGKGGGLGKGMGGGPGKGMGKGLGSMAKMGKVLGPVIKGLGMAAGAIGMAAAAIGTLALGLGAVIGVFAGLIAVIVAADSKMKGLNKSLLETVGGTDMLGKGFDSATASINAMRDAAIGAQFRLGSLAKDNIKILTTLHEHGVTVREISKDATSAASALGHYQKAMGLVLTTSRMIGESASTVAQNMAQQADDLGMTLQQVAEKFSTIGRFAMESGFSTKRFFSMVIQATSGMSMYNVRLEEAAGMLVRIGKILGQKTGGEFLQSLTKGFVDKSMTDRIKQVKLAGTGNTKETLEHSANNTADAFIQKLQGNGNFGNMTMAQMGVEGDDRKITDMTSQQLVAVLKQMTPQQQAKFNARFHMEATKADAANADGLARQMKILTDVSVASKGGLLNMAKGLDSLDMGGKLNMLRNSMKTMFPGKEIHELSTLQLAALENATGMQGSQLKEMRNLTASFDGNFQTLEEIKKTGYVNANGQKMTAEEIKAAQQAQVRAFGAYTDESGQIVAATINSQGEIFDKLNADGSTKVIKDLTDYYNSQGDNVKKQVEAANFNEDRAIAQEIASNTFSIKDLLDASITSILNMIYKGVMSIVKKLWGADKSGVGEAIKIQGELMKQASEEMLKASQKQQEIVKLERQLKGEKDEGKRGEIEAKIAQLKLEKDRHTGFAMDSEYAADKVFDAQGEVNQKNLKVARDQVTFFSGSTAREDVMSEEGGTALKGSIYEEMLNDKDYQRRRREATPSLQASAEQARATDVLLDADASKFKDVRSSQAVRTAAQSVPSVSVNSDRSMTEFMLRDTDGRDVQDVMAGNYVGGSAHSRDYGISGLGETVTHRQILEGYDTARRNRQGKFFAADMDSNLVDRQSTGNYSGYSGNIFRKAGTDWTNSLDVPNNMTDPSFNGVGSTYSNAISSGVTVQEMMDADTRDSWVVDRVQARNSYTTGGAANTMRTHQNSAITGLGEHTESLAPSNATLSAFTTGADGSNNSATVDIIKQQVGDLAVHLRSLGVDLTKGSVDTVRVNNESKDMGFGVAGQGAWAPTNTSYTDRVAQYAGTQDSNLSNKEGAHDSTGKDLMGLYQEIKTQIQAGLVTGSDGEPMEIEDLDGLVKEALDASKVAGEQLTGASFEAWLQKEQKGPWADIAKNRAAVMKIKQHAKKQEEFLKKIEASTDPESAKEDSAKALMGYIGREGDSASINKLKQGEELTGQGLRTLKAQLYANARDEDGDGTITNAEALSSADESIKQALLNLGVQLPAYQDFIYQGGSTGGVIRPIHGQDSFLAMRPRGPAENAMNRTGGGGQNQIVEVKTVCAICLKKEIVAQSRQTGPGGRMTTRAGRGNFG